MVRWEGEGGEKEFNWAFSRILSVLVVSYHRVQARYHRVFRGLHSQKYILTFLMNVWPPAKSNVDHEKCTKSNVTVFLLYA